MPPDKENKPDSKKPEQQSSQAPNSPPANLDFEATGHRIVDNKLSVLDKLQKLQPTREVKPGFGKIPEKPETAFSLEHLTSTEKFELLKEIVGDKQELSEQQKLNIQTVALLQDFASVIAITQEGEIPTTRKIYEQPQVWIQTHMSELVGRALTDESFSMKGLLPERLERLLIDNHVPIEKIQTEAQLQNFQDMLVTMARNFKAYGVAEAAMERYLSGDFVRGINMVSEQEKLRLRFEANANITTRLNENVLRHWRAGDPSHGIPAMDEEEISEAKNNFTEVEYQTLLRQHVAEKYFETRIQFTGYKQKTWQQYKDMLDPKKEWGNVKDKTEDLIWHELLLNAPLIMVSGTAAGVARFVVRSSVRAAFPKFTERVLVGAVSKYAAGAAGTFVEGITFDVIQHAVSFRAYQDLPDFAKSVLWSSVTLGLFHKAGKLSEAFFSKKIPTAHGDSVMVRTLLGEQMAKINHAGLREVTKDLLVKGHVEAATMLLVGAMQNGIYNGNLDEFFSAFGDELLHAYVSVSALKVSGRMLKKANAWEEKFENLRSPETFQLVEYLEKNVSVLEGRTEYVPKNKLGDYTRKWKEQGWKIKDTWHQGSWAGNEKVYMERTVPFQPKANDMPRIYELAKIPRIREKIQQLQTMGVELGKTISFVDFLRSDFATLKELLMHEQPTPEILQCLIWKGRRGDLPFAFIQRVAGNKKLFNSLQEDYYFQREFFANAKDLSKLTHEQLKDAIDLIDSYHGEPETQIFILHHAESLLKIDSPKRPLYIEICREIVNSPSREILRLKEPLIKQLLQLENPVDAYRRISNIFVKNNLPPVGKIFKIFEILYPAERIKSSLNDRSSPILNNSGPRKRRNIFYRDLLKVHIESGNHSLREYIEVLQSGEALLASMEKGEQLTGKQQKQLEYFFNKLDTLLANSDLPQTSPETHVTLEARYQGLRQNLGVRDGQTVTDRIAEMFVKPIGYKNLSQVLERMSQVKREAHDRNVGSVQGQTELIAHEGDLFKGVDEKNIGFILQGGAVAREFLGSSSDSDATPFDTDVSRVEKKDLEGGMASIVQHSLARNYGQLILVIRDRGQFQHTQEGKNSYDPDKLELFKVGISNAKHYGIRTGFASSEIDAMIVQDQLKADHKAMEKLYFEIAKNGIYIPITDVHGKIIFTLDMYKMHRRAFRGLERFNGEPFTYGPSNNPRHAEDLMEIKKDLARDQLVVPTLTGKIFETLKDVLQNKEVHLKDEFDTSLLGAELHDIGSTGRKTNLPGNYDFDMSLRLDLKDHKNAQDIVGEIKKQFSFKKDESHADEQGYYQIRLFGVTRIGSAQLEKPIDIDIGIASKSDTMHFMSHEAVQDRLLWIGKNLGVETRDAVISNIVLAKRLLKEGGAYKKLDGGFGGIGVENWILGHNGNLVEAFQTFQAAAYENGKVIDLDTFKTRYQVLDPGFNIKFQNYDNYVQLLKPEGYNAMLSVINRYLGSLR